MFTRVIDTGQPKWIISMAARRMTVTIAGMSGYSTNYIWTWSGNPMAIGFQTTNVIRRGGLISWTGTLIVTDLAFLRKLHVYSLTGPLKRWINTIGIPITSTPIMIS